MSEQFNRGDRVVDDTYGAGTVRYLSGDLMPDGSGRHYHWPGHVCVEFDNSLPNGETVFVWCKFNEIRKEK